MASGKKNYFRHSIFARKHPAIAGLVDDLGKEAYYHFFVLIELCAEQASGDFPIDSKFVFRRSTLCHELLVTNSRLGHHLLAMTPSLVDDIVVTEKEVHMVFPKLSKYMGKYESKSTSNAPKEKKEKEKKRKEIKVNKSNTPKELKVSPVSKNNDPIQNEKNIIYCEAFSGDQSTPEAETSNTVQNILTALNTICLKNFRPTAANVRFINARLKEGYKLEDFKAVIQLKHDQWSNNPQMSAYLRPSTIFGTKFDGYLEEARKPFKTKIRASENFGLTNDEIEEAKNLGII